ncbi:MAG: FAD-dependent oxidoreductase [Deltaproteobacteria bacterium]|nr:FAD-dependent oxidoreductase [Deltaproteobacteria bacterium]
MASKLKVISVDTDVLIIGGGLAGCMAAIKAAEQEDVRVTLVDKSNTKASGCAAAGVDHLWGYIPPIHEKMGYTLDDMAEDHRQGIAHGFFRRDLFYLVAGTLYDRVLDLEKFGIQFRYEDGKAPGNFRIVPQFHSVPTSFNFDGATLKPNLTKEAKKRGVKIINRVQATDLITTDGQISGAVGVNVRTGDIYFFRAKAVVLSSGRSNRLGRNPTGFDFNTRMPSPLSGDGTAMAIRSGLPVINTEFLGDIRPAPCANYNPNYGDPRNTVQPAARIIDEKGQVLVPRSQFYDWENLGKEKWNEDQRKEWLIEHRESMGKKGDMMDRMAKGGGPFYLDFSEATDYEKEYIEWSIGNEGRGTQFLRYFRKEEGLDLGEYAQEYAGYWTREMSGTAAKGLWVDKDLETDIKNLFGAGDEVAGLPWQAAPGAVTQGWHAGDMAAKRAAAQKEHLPAGEDTVKARADMCAAILDRKEGFFWKEVEIYVQNLMDFYCGSVRSASMLERGLERLEYARSAPLKAENPHELGRALDVTCIIDNAELILRSSIERKESRPIPFGFRRADFPEKDDENWLIFLGIKKEEDGKFSFKKYPVDK